jgi:hypothetical protein
MFILTAPSRPASEFITIDGLLTGQKGRCPIELKLKRLHG